MKLLVLSTAILALAAGSAYAAPYAVTVGKAVPPVIDGKKKHKVVCKQAGADTGVGLASETFTDFSGYDSAGAGDCKLKKKAKLIRVDATGVFYNGAGPANSFTVTIYDDAGGKPGAVSNGGTAVRTDATATAASPAIHLSPAISLAPGQYWVSVQPSMTFGVGGQWGWELGAQVNMADQWTEDGGLGTACNPFGNWDTPANCTGYGGDFMFDAST